MKDQKKPAGQVAFFLAVSILGLAVSASLLVNPAPLSSEFSRHTVIALLIYGLVCTLGILAVLFPTACSGVFETRQSSTESLRGLETRATSILGVLVLHGHHPLESEAMVHELRFGEKSFCANCFGLLTGATLALATVVMFTISGWPAWTEVRLAYVLYFLGIALVVPGLVQPFAPSAGARTRFISAAVFVVGTSFMLIATDVITGNMMANLYVVLLAIFWLLSRLSLSHRD